MDDGNWEMVTRKGKKRPPSTGTITGSDDKLRARSSRSGNHRNRSYSPPPNRTPSLHHGQVREPRRESSDLSLRVVWQNDQAFSTQLNKKSWQERLVQSTETPRRADAAIIRQGVTCIPDDADQTQRITVDYRTGEGDHTTTWHLDLSEAELSEFKEMARPRLTNVATEPLPRPPWEASFSL